MKKVLLLALMGSGSLLAGPCMCNENKEEGEEMCMCMEGKMAEEGCSCMMQESNVNEGEENAPCACRAVTCSCHKVSDAKDAK